MVHAKNYDTVSTFVNVMQSKLWRLFSIVYMYHLLTLIFPKFVIIVEFINTDDCLLTAQHL